MCYIIFHSIVYELVSQWLCWGVFMGIWFCLPSFFAFLTFFSRYRLGCCVVLVCPQLFLLDIKYLKMISSLGSYPITLYAFTSQKTFYKTTLRCKHLHEQHLHFILCHYQNAGRACTYMQTISSSFTWICMDMYIKIMCICMWIIACHTQVFMCTCGFADLPSSGIDYRT